MNTNLDICRNVLNKYRKSNGYYRPHLRQEIEDLTFICDSEDEYKVIQKLMKLYNKKQLNDSLKFIL